jgi:predicted O-methyltransferase YrrM
MGESKHKLGELESIKFDHRRKYFYEYLNYLKEKDINTLDLMEHYTAYAGHMALNRTFTLYEYYKMAQNISGHVAEIGVYKGAGTMLFAKLVKIFESESLTQVHGFYWFKGTGISGENDSKLVPKGGYQCNLEDLNDLIKLQKLDNIVRIHDMDLTSPDLEKFFGSYKHLQFKLIFMDAGMYDIMKNCIPLFWERLTPGGIMVFDQHNHEFGPGETIAIREFLPNAKIKTLPNSWMPNAYVIKE